jgi:hypothetical protein
MTTTSPAAERSAAAAARLSKLPQWVQNVVANLEEENARLRATIEGTDDGNSSAYLSNGYGAPQTPLGEHAQVEFHVGDDVILVRVGDSGGRPYLDVNGNDGILVQPWSTNHVKVISERNPR